MANRKRANDIGIEGISDFHNKSWNNEHYHVQVGNYGVVVPDELNLDTLEGLKLIKGKASIITNKKLAESIAVESGGSVLMVTEVYVREGVILK